MTAPGLEPGLEPSGPAPGGADTDTDVGELATGGTGDPRVDAAIARLDELDDTPTADHVAVFEDVHGRLHDALADLESTG